MQHRTGSISVHVGRIVGLIAANPLLWPKGSINAECLRHSWEIAFVTVHCSESVPTNYQGLRLLPPPKGVDLLVQFSRQNQTFERRLCRHERDLERVLM
jgi:hypothetical protein